MCIRDRQSFREYISRLRSPSQQHLAIRCDDSMFAFHCVFTSISPRCVLPRSNKTLQQEDFSSSPIAKVVLGGPSRFPQRSCHSGLQPFLPHEPATNKRFFSPATMSPRITVPSLKVQKSRRMPCNISFSQLEPRRNIPPFPGAWTPP